VRVIVYSIVKSAANDHPLDLVKTEVFELADLNHNRALADEIHGEWSSSMNPNRPKLSVVIAAVNGPEVLSQTLNAIDKLPERGQIEVVVVGTEAVNAQSVVNGRPESCRVILGGRLTDGIPRLRYAGVMAAKGELIAIVEDHVDVDKNWASTIFQVMEDPSISAVGGRVDAGQDGWVNWGVFLADYARYIGPVEEGDHADLPGNNIAYRSEALLAHADSLAEGKWESWVNAKLVGEGHRLVSTNHMVVRHCKRFKLAEFLRLRWHFGRSYAGMRIADLGPLKRIVYGVGSTILPVMLTVRATRLLSTRDIPRFKLAKCWPLIAMVMTVGAAGECFGYLFGPGRSLEQVR
jgi:glycosyltransferase involved in cell wall biosynthesis